MESLREIKSQIEQLEKKAVAVKRSETKKVIAQIKALMKEFELSPRDLGFTSPDVGRNALTKPKKKSIKKVRTRRLIPVKYRNASGDTWTGRGKKPVWLATAIANGASIEEFRVVA